MRRIHDSTEPDGSQCFTLSPPGLLGSAVTVGAQFTWGGVHREGVEVCRCEPSKNPGRFWVRGVQPSLANGAGQQLPSSAPFDPGHLSHPAGTVG